MKPVDGASDKEPTAGLNQFPAQVLLGLRDAASAALGVSVTITNPQGLPVDIEPFHNGRRFTVRACQLFHCRIGSPVKTQVCDIWDEQAAQHVNANGTPYDSPCALGYSCMAIPIFAEGTLQGLIFAGERRLVTKSSEDNLADMQTALTILNLRSSTERERYEKEWFKGCRSPYLLTPEEWAATKENLNYFAAFVGNLLSQVKSRKLVWSSRAMDILRTAKDFRQSVAGALEDLDSRARDSILELIAAGFPLSNQWLWEFNDPEVIDPAQSGRLTRLAYVIFADVRGFSDACNVEGLHKVDPERRTLLTQALDVVKGEGGIVDKFIGDALLAYFFLPSSPGIEWPQNKARELEVPKAVARCALKMQELERVAGSTRLRFGIGVTYGEVLFGQFVYEGQEGTRREITGIGAVVNKSQRLSMLARKRNAFGVRPAVLVDEKAHQGIDATGSFVCDHVDTARFRGFGIENYELVYALRQMAPALASPDQREVTEAGEKVVNLSQGFLSTPPSYVVDAMQDYYEVLKHRRAQLALGDPQLRLPGMMATLLECREAHLTFRSSTTGCIEDALTAIVDHDRLHSRLYVRKKKSLMNALITSLEHPSVEAAVRARFERVDKVELTTTRSCTGLSQGAITRAFSEKLNQIDTLPTVVILPHISWETGVLFPIRELSFLIRSMAQISENPTPYIVIDGAHALGHVRIQIELTEGEPPPFHFYATCAHKWLRGPHSVGICWVSPEVLSCEECTRRLAGADIFTRTSGLGAQYSYSQSRTHDRAKAYATVAAVHHSLQLSRSETVGEGAAKRFQQILAFRNRLRDILCADKLVCLSTPMPAKLSETGILTFYIEGASGVQHAQIKDELEKRGVLVDLLGGEPGALRCCIASDITSEDIRYAVQMFRGVLDPGEGKGSKAS